MPSTGTRLCVAFIDRFHAEALTLTFDLLAFIFYNLCMRKFFLTVMLSFIFFSVAMVFAQDSRLPELPKEFTSHRGMRVLSDSDDGGRFSIVAIRTSKCTGGMYVDFVFTEELDPRHIFPSQFEIDGKSLPDGIKFKFNKIGNVARIFVEGTYIKKLKVEGVRSFSGAVLDTVTAENISADSEVNFFPGSE